MPPMPDYRNPPLVEVVVGVQFAPIEKLLTPYIGGYWETIREKYSRVDERPPIPHLIEKYPAVSIGAEIKMLSKPEMPRIWFIDSSGNRLVQFQHDRFLFNWRKAKSGDEYPRYPSVREEFFLRWEGFCSFLNDEGLPQPKVDQCEVTYVNHILKGGSWDSFGDIERLFTVVNWRTRTEFLPCPESIRLSLRFVLPEKQGRLHVEALPAIVSGTGDEVIRLSLTVRGEPIDRHTTAGLGKWFDLAREWIVRGFADLTAKETDITWERIA